MEKISLACIIDDNHAFQFITRRILESIRKIENVVQFRDGEEALEYFRAHQQDVSKIPELIFLDIKMPYINGWQFLDQLISLQLPEKPITIYICTSSTDPKDKAKYNAYSGLKGYIVKPMQKEALGKILEKTLKELLEGD